MWPPHLLNEESWSVQVCEVLDVVNRLSLSDLVLGAAWCRDRAPRNLFTHVRSVGNALERPWPERLRDSLDRITVSGRWKHHFAAEGEPFPVQGLSAACHLGVTSLFLPEGYEEVFGDRVPVSMRLLDEVRLLVDGANAAPELRDIVVSLAPDWAGSPEDLLQAARSLHGTGVLA